MTKRLSYLGALTALLFTLGGVATKVAGAPPDKCIDDWAKAAAIVRERQMLDISDLSRLAREKYDARIMTARLCSDNDGYFYRLVIRGADGSARQIKVDAALPPGLK